MISVTGTTATTATPGRLCGGPTTRGSLAGFLVAVLVDRASARDRWQISHVLRTGAAVLALGCLTAAALVTGDRSPLRTTTRDGSPSCSI